MRIAAVFALLAASVCIVLSGCESLAQSSEATHGDSEASAHHESEHHQHKILVTSPVKRNIVNTRPYVCQIHSCQHIEVKALEGGYLQEIRVQEGEAVKKGELMFKILPIVYQANLDAKIAEANKIQIELDNAQTLLQKNYVSPQQIALKKAELAKAQAEVTLVRAELSFTSVTAPFDGIVDRQMNQLGSLIEEGDVLTTLSDNSKMWVYFNVPEKAYLEYKAELDKNDGSAERLQIELKLANGEIFPEKGEIGAIEADFDSTTGTVLFRADFLNPSALLRNGQTGTILIHKVMDGALVIPQRAKYEILAQQYVYVVDKDNVVRQRDIKVGAVQDDIFVIEKGLEEDDKIVLEGVQQVHDGDKIEYEFVAPEEVLGNLKYHAE